MWQEQCFLKQKWHAIRIYYDTNTTTYIVIHIWIELYKQQVKTTSTPLWKSNRNVFFFQNQIWSRSFDFNWLCLVCIRRSIEKVKTCQISKCGYQNGPSDETLKKARCQFCDDKFGYRIMEAVGFFDYEMCDFTQITFNFTNRWSQGVVSRVSDIILHKWYFRKLHTIKWVKIIGIGKN